MRPTKRRRRGKPPFFLFGRISALPGEVKGVGMLVGNVEELGTSGAPGEDGGWFMPDKEPRPVAPPGSGPGLGGWLGELLGPVLEMPLGLEPELLLELELKLVLGLGTVLELEPMLELLATTGWPGRRGEGSGGIAWLMSGEGWALNPGRETGPGGRNAYEGLNLAEFKLGGS
jgi:hypothetical protein